MECRTSCRSEFIPLAMQNANRWTIWAPRQVEKNDGSTRWTKVPLDGEGHEADITDAKNLHGFKQTFIAAGLKSLGVGFVSGSGWAGIDIDHCIDENGEFSALASLILSECGSYAEKSPSGRGVRIFCKAKSAGYINRKNAALGLEIATDKKFFTVTGDALPGCKEINERSEFLLELLATYFPASENEPGKQTQQTQEESAPRPGPRAKKASLELSDQDLLRKARNARNEGAIFAALYDRGDISGFPSHSEADLRLLGQLAYWTQRNAARMRLFWQSSALWREDKCEDRSDYVPDSIALAIANCKNTYDPSYNDFRELPTPGQRSAKPGPTAAPDIVDTPCESSGAQTSPTNDNGADEDTSLPDDMPSPEPPPIGSGLPLLTWKRVGRSLKQWKEQLDNNWRWKLGDWWNSARADVPHGEKEAFLKKQFGSGMRKHVVQSYAPICAHIPEEERSKVPAWWVYRELGDVDQEKREEVYQEYHTRLASTKEGGKALNRKDLLALIGQSQTKCVDPPHDCWWILKNDPQFKKLAKPLAQIVEAASQNDADALQKMKYITDCIEGRLWQGNDAAKDTPGASDSASSNFPHGGKMDTPENADFEKESPPVSVCENDTVFAQEKEEICARMQDSAEPDSDVSSSPPPSVLINTDTPKSGEADGYGWSYWSHIRRMERTTGKKRDTVLLFVEGSSVVRLTQQDGQEWKASPPADWLPSTTDLTAVLDAAADYFERECPALDPPGERGLTLSEWSALHPDEFNKTKEAPSASEGDDHLAQWREEVKQEWAQSVQRGDMAALTSSLLSCIWQREVTLPARDAFQRATADELGRLVYYLDHGEALQPSADGAQYLPGGGAQA